jgi:HAD superfamily hydrolase (TIGR01490 family)
MRAAFFDLDKTVIAKASIAAFGRPLRRGGLVRRRVLLRVAVSHLIYLQFGADEERMARIRRSMLAVTKGWERDRVRAIVRETLLKTIEPLIFNEALELMEEHRRAGDRIYLVSASPEEIVLPLAELLGADGAISSRGELDEEGRYTGEMAFYADGPGKAQAVRELAARYGIDLARSSAYSDSATDLPMLEAVGHPVAVNADRPLAKIAKERGWETATFTKPVRLRDRMTVRTPVLTTSMVMAVGAAVLLWRGYRSRLASRSSAAAAHPARERRGLRLPQFRIPPRSTPARSTT